MQVDATGPGRGQGNTLEAGDSTWGGERSIRDRWPTSNGGFSPHSSPEFALSALPLFVEFAARPDVNKGTLSRADWYKIKVAAEKVLLDIK